MQYTIFDTPDTVTAKLPALKAAGITAIIRYDDPSNNPHSWKQVSVAEYRAILAHGIDVGIVSEWGNNHDGYFNASAGRRDANYSVAKAHERGQPPGTAIYGAADYDVTTSGLTNYVVPYFKLFTSTLRAAGYRVGCYGSGYCCSVLSRANLIDNLPWITCSSGFNGSKAAVQNGNFAIRQVFGLCDQTYMGLSVDWDAAHASDWGQVSAGSHPPPPPPPVIHGAVWVQGVLKLRGFYDGAVDGIIGPQTIAAIAAYMESKGET